MATYRTLGTIGFVLSAIVNITILTIHLAAVAVYIYPVSIVARSLGWFRLGEAFRNDFYKLTGLTVLILGTIVFLVFSPFREAIGLGPIEKMITMPLLLWLIYSLLELVSYSKLRTYTRRFSFARISVLGIAIIITGVLRQVGLPPHEWGLHHILSGFIFLASSAILAALGFRELPECRE